MTQSKAPSTQVRASAVKTTAAKPAPRPKPGFFARLATALRGLFGGARKRGGRVWRKGQSARMGIYGSPNAGKSQLANTMCKDWTGEVLGSVSHVPHETRKVQTKKNVVLKDGDVTLTVDVMDTPGLVSSVSITDLEVFYGMDSEEAARRAKEATDGILDAIKALQHLTGMLLVIDCTTDPLQQVNQVLIAHVRARNLPVIVVANKIDLPDAQPERVRAVFGNKFPVIPVSALTGKNMDVLYHEMFRRFA